MIWIKYRRPIQWWGSPPPPSSVGEVLLGGLHNNFYSYENVGSYLAGLLEGDGNINIRRDKNSNQVLGLAYDFTFDKNNITLYEELKICLGFGNIYKKNDNTMRYVIFNTQGVIKLSNLINGNLRTPKINTFYKLIDILNLKYSLNIPKLPIDFSSFKFWRIG